MRLIVIIFVFLSLLLASPHSLCGQTRAGEKPYYLGLKRDLLYGTGAAGSVVLGKVLRERTPDIVLADLRLASVPEFDQVATEFSSDTARKWSDHSLYASSALPALLLLSPAGRQYAGTIGLLFAETMLLNQGLTDIIKSSAKRPRPYVFDENLPPETVIKGNDRAAFLSGHTSTSAAAGFFFARVFADTHPESKLRPYAWVLGAGLPALTGYLRIRAGQHYPSDVLAGYALGGLIGYLVPALHRRPTRKRRVSLALDGAGGRLVYRW
ncbi:phosphatase PAP2 family protein [Neolewinella litorea]|uniref:Phosphatase PAP2 family protein n=1 Tax=Neolewinella litorea TaxID=2562452 RepID=A0A4V3XL69_9BACT|nr:phosphatase PAP2 family protein [Neolewinella litorea]THH39663.1 phosphatase PAP2 family protein [Neolewinella litorea]